METIPLKNVTVKKTQTGKYPVYGITIPKTFIDNGILNEGEEVQVIIKKKNGLEINAQGGI